MQHQIQFSTEELLAITNAFKLLEVTPKGELYRTKILTKIYSTIEADVINNNGNFDLGK